MEKLQLPSVLEPFRKQFEDSVKPYIKITPTKGATQLWESKFGGDPYMPIGNEYPRDTNGIPLKLLAQLNFEEIPHLPNYPTTGILQFYIALNDVSGIDWEDQITQKGFRIIYTTEVTKDTTKLVTNFEFISESTINIAETICDECFPLEYECKLTFNIATAPVGLSDYTFSKLFGTPAYEFFDKLINSIDTNDCDDIYDIFDKLHGSNGCKIGGYANGAQEDPRENDMYSNFNTLLFQMDTDFGSGICWGDAGTANFFIKEEDLKNLEFSTVVYNWNSH